VSVTNHVLPGSVASLEDVQGFTRLRSVATAALPALAEEVVDTRGLSPDSDHGVPAARSCAMFGVPSFYYPSPPSGRALKRWRIVLYGGGRHHGAHAVRSAPRGGVALTIRRRTDC